MSSDSEDYSDEDYNPDKDVSPAGSEIESDDEVDEEAAGDSENEKGVSAGKRKKKTAPGSARKKPKQPEVKETEDDPDDEEAEKKRADALWADFLGDEAPVEKEKPRKEISKVTATETRTRKIESPPKQEEKKEPVVIKEIFEFAGEQVVVEKEVKVAAAAPESSASSKRGFPVARSGGLGSVLGALNKKNKISTLEKSKLDWDRFKKDEGIADDLKNYNRDGYLERQDFLERTDLRQFEIEKSIKKKK